MNGVISSSGTLVLPTITAPAARRRRTTSASAVAGSPKAFDAARGHLARDVGVVLDRDRHAEQRAAIAAAAAPVGLGGLGERALAEHDAERVEGRVEARDALQVGLGELPRGDVPRGDQLGLAREAGEDGVGG